MAESDTIIITGACSGLPYEAAHAAYKKNRTEIWGFSPASDYEGQVKNTPSDDNIIYSRLIYTPADFEYISDIRVARKYRNVLSTAAYAGNK